MNAAQDTSSSLPMSWRTEPLSASNASRPSTIDPARYPDETFEYYSIPAYQENQRPTQAKGGDIGSSKLLLDAGTILFGKLNPRVEKVWRVGNYTKHRKLGSTEWLPLIPRDDVDEQFLYFLMWSEHVMPKAKTLVSGSTPSRQRVDPSSFYRIEVPLPPLTEQRKIAGVLGLLQRAMEQQERLIALTTELKKALLHQLFTQGLRGEPQKQTDIGPVPESWELRPCEELCEMITVGVVVKPASHYVESGVPAFRSMNVREDRLEVTELVYFSQETNDTILAKSKLRTGDVLIVRTGYPGTSCVVPEEYDGANCIDLVIARPQLEVIQSGFLSRFFNSDAGKRQALSAKHGLAQQHLNVGAVKRTLIPVPQLDEQREIDAALAIVERKLALHMSKHAALTALFRTLLHQLMTAQLRVYDLDSPELGAVIAEGEK